VIDIMILYLILGAVLVTLGVPLLSSITDLIVTGIELLKALITVKIVECNAKIGGSETTRAIGFAVSEEDEEEYE
jgi:hypothetical protein